MHVIIQVESMWCVFDDFRYFLVSSFLLGITGYYGSALMSTSAYLGVSK